MAVINHPAAKYRTFLIMALLGAIILALILLLLSRMDNWFKGPDPESVASASLQSIREQSRLTALSARYVAVVTSSQQRFGLTSRKTLIMPGNMRYEIDLAKLQQRNVRWDGSTNTLSVTLPALEISRPEIDLDQVREYGGQGLLSRLTNVEERLDVANRQAAQRELVRQARAPVPMRLARDAAKRSVARTFAMPLRAAGIEANVEVRFADEPGEIQSYWDRSRPMEDVLRERRQGS